MRVAVSGGTWRRPCAGAGDDVRAGDTRLHRRHRRASSRGRRAGQHQRRRRSTSFPAARVAVLSTGDELVTDGVGRCGPARSARATPRCSPRCWPRRDASSSTGRRCADDEAALEAVLRDAAATCDAVVTSGGVSMGDYDVVKAVLGRIADMRWMQIAIKPAKPFAFGTLGRRRRRVRAARQPGQLAGQLRAAGPAGAAADDGPPPRRPPAASVGVTDVDLRRQPDGKVHFVRVTGDVRRRRSAATCARSAPRAATSWRPPPWPTPSSCCPTATASPPGADVAVLLLS